MVCIGLFEACIGIPPRADETGLDSSVCLLGLYTLMVEKFWDFRGWNACGSCHGYGLGKKKEEPESRRGARNFRSRWEVPYYYASIAL